MPTLYERARTIRDGLDAGVPVDDVRVDIDALIADIELIGSDSFEDPQELLTTVTEVCNVCCGPIHRVGGPGEPYWRHAVNLPYCPSKQPTPLS